MTTGGKTLPPPPGSCPWLVYSHGEDYENQIFCCNISGPGPITTYRKRIPALKDKSVITSSYGWLMLYDWESSRVCVCNSSTFEIIYLPSPDMCSCALDHGYVLSSSPNSSDCKVFVFLKDRPTILCCGVRDENWSEISYREQLNALDPRIKDDEEEPPKEGSWFFREQAGTLLFREPVLCGGKIYARVAVLDVCEYPESWSIEIVEEEAAVGVKLSKIDSRPKWIHRLSGPSNEYVVESSGELFSLHILWGGIKYTDTVKIEVSKLNSDTMVWERVESIKDRSFFACRDYCVSCPTSGPGYIYYTMGRDQSLYCYDMEEDSVLVSLPPSSNVPDPWLNSVWIMPEELIRPQEDSCNDSCKVQNDIVSLDTKDECGEDLAKQLSDLQIDVPVPVPNWRTIFMSDSKSSPSALLMFPGHESQGRYNFVDPITNHCYSMKIPDILKDTIFRNSNQDWLLMSRKKVNHLYNPFTGEVLSSKTDFEDSFFLASKPSGSDSDHFVAVTFYGKEVEIYYPRTNKSTSHELESNKDFNPTYDVPVFFKDAFYYIDENGHLGKLKVEQEKYTLEVLDPPQKTCDSFRQIFLVECDGELLSVFIGSDGKYVLVYKLNESKTAWKIITSLGKYNLYLSRRSSSFSLVSSSGEGNKIYFTRFRDSGIVYYSLDTSKWHSVGSENSSNNFYDTKLMLNACWIRPSTSHEISQPLETTCST